MTPTRDANEECEENGNEENEENYIVNWKIMQKKSEKKREATVVRAGKGKGTRERLVDRSA